VGGIVGRELEQRHLLESLNSARAGSATSIVLDGEAGIGKSTLLEWMCRNADGFTVLRVRGHEADMGSSYLVLRQLLKPILHHVPELETHLADALDSALRMSDAPTNESLVPLAVLELCSAATTTGPLLLALDDAHWFDLASLDALTFVARRVNSERLVVGFGIRSHELAGAAQLQDVPRLHLVGLDDKASRALAEAAGRQFSPRLRDLSRGNPLALQHLDVTDGSEHGQIPDRLRRGFETELAALPAATQRALAIAAVAGSAPAEVRRAALEAAGFSEADLTVAVHAGVLRDDGEFRHPLLREVATPAVEHTGSIHAALALAYEASNPGLALLHRLRGSAEVNEADLAAAHEIAETLAANGRGDDALALFSAAAQRASGAQRSQLFLRCAHIHSFAARYPASVPFFRRARDAAPDAQHRLQATRSMVWAEMWSGSTLRDSAARLLVELRASASSEVDREQQSKAWGSLIALYIACDNYSALAAIAEMPDGLDVEGDVLICLCFAADPAAVAARRVFEERLKSVTRLTHGFLDASADAQGELLLVEGRWTEANIWSQRQLDDMRSVPYEADVGPTTGRHIISRAFLGDCLTAFGLALTTLERVPGDGSALGTGALAAAIVGADVATEWATKCVAIGEQHGITAFLIDGRHRLALVALGAGDVGPAVQICVEAWRLMTDYGYRHPGYTFARGDIAEVFALSGRGDDARAVIAELEAGPFQVAWACGVAARVRGMLGEVGQFERAVSLLVESPWEVARTHLAWSRALPANSAEQRRHAQTALDAFESMGARPWAAQAREVLSVVDSEGPTNQSVDPLAQLSGRERTVAFAVARGLSNKEVAGELYISLKTVDAHLQQIYRKLDIRSRTQLAALCHAPIPG
jgi:DNA-binding CsgD family transcriptional regulator